LGGCYEDFVTVGILDCEEEGDFCCARGGFGGFGGHDGFYAGDFVCCLWLD